MKRILLLVVLLALLGISISSGAERLDSFVDKYNEANKDTEAPKLWVEAEINENNQVEYYLSDTIRLYIRIDDQADVKGFTITHDGSKDKDEFLMYCKALIRTLYGEDTPQYYSAMLKRLDEQDGYKEGNPFYVREWGYGGHYVSFDNVQQLNDDKQ